MNRKTTTVMISITKTTALSLCLLSAPFACESFQPFSASTKSRRSFSNLFSTIEPRGKGRGKNANDGSWDSLESTREALEEMMMQQHSQHLQDEGLHIMTSAGRHRRQLEMDLLRQLYY